MPIKIYIACDCPPLSKAIEAAIARLGVECSPSCILATENAAGALAARDTNELAVLFFAVSDFSGSGLQLLQDLCVRKLQNVQVIAVGADLTPTTILKAVRAGAVDCLDISRDFDKELAESVAREKALSLSTTTIGRLITVIGSTGGCGASLLAANLAVVIAQRQRRCALLDLHVRGGDLAALLKCNPPYTILSLAAKSEQLDREMFAQSLTQHDSGVSLLASPAPLGDYRAIRPELIQRAVQFARGMFDTVVVDLEDCEHPGQVQALAASDAIVLAMRPDIVSLHRAKHCLQFLTKAGVSQDHIFVVVNRVDLPKALELSQIEPVLGMRIAHALRDDPATVMSSVNLGIPFVLASPQSPVSRCITELVEVLLGAETPDIRPTWASRQMSRLRSMAAAACGLPAICGLDYRTTS
jgi:pilus assembly protein CpaE